MPSQATPPRLARARQACSATVQRRLLRAPQAVTRPATRLLRARLGAVPARAQAPRSAGAASPRAPARRPSSLLDTPRRAAVPTQPLRRLAPVPYLPSFVLPSTSLVARELPRSVRRRLDAGEQARDTTRQLSITEVASVGKRSRQQYISLLNQFLTSSRPGTLAVTAPLQDAALVRFYDELYLAGKVASSGEKLLAAISMHVPDYQNKGRLALPRAHRALRGWRLLRPSRTRRPLPWAACMGIARQLWQLTGKPQLAVFWLMMVDTYLRPGEAHRLSKGQVFPPQAKMPKVTIHINPDYMKRPSKTGEMDETVDVARPWLAALIVQLGVGDPTDPLWDFTMTDAKRAFDNAAASLDLGKLQLVLYTARHSGASIDRFTGRISLQEVQRRGRWRQPNSVRRYEKRGLIQTVWSGMSERARKYCLQAEADLPTLLAAAFRKGYA